jgi:Ca2+-binding RTX toxin-like protein
LSLCIVNPIKEAGAITDIFSMNDNLQSNNIQGSLPLTDIFSMNDNLQSNNIQGSLPLTDIFSMNDNLQSNNIQGSLLEDNIITCIGLVCDGTNNDDIIIGSFLSEMISGLKGNDVIQGNNGEDIIYGGDGSDSIQGGAGIDNIFGQDGDDFIYADGSTSLASSLTGDEIAIVNELNDWLLGVDNQNFVTITDISIKDNSIGDVFTSLNSNMLVFPESYLDGGNGDDHIFGGSLNDVLSGGQGNDYFDCNEGIDRVLDFDPDDDTANVNCESLE